MSYASLPPDVRSTAESVLTRKQLDVFRMWANQATISNIALTLDISEERAYRIKRRAQQKVEIAMRKENAA